MITRLYDEQFYPFAPQMKEKLNGIFGALLKRCDSIYEEYPNYVKDFSVAISSKDTSDPLSDKYHFRIRLDQKKVLEITGIYEVKTNLVSDVELVANLPFIKEWSYDSLRFLQLKKKDKDQFLRSQLKFVGSLNRNGIEAIITDNVRTSVTRKLPIVQILFRNTAKPTFLFLQQKLILKVFIYIYRYHQAMTLHMEKIVNSSKT